MNDGVWVAIGAVGDDPNASGTEIIGVFSTEEKALAAARVRWPYTAEAEWREIDVIPDWAKPDA